MKRIRILSDYSPADSPNTLNIVLDDQGDIHVSVYESQKREGVRLAMSGSRHRGEASVKVWQAFRALVEAYEETLADEFCHPALKKVNQ